MAGSSFPSWARGAKAEGRGIRSLQGGQQKVKPRGRVPVGARALRGHCCQWSRGREEGKKCPGCPCLLPPVSRPEEPGDRGGLQRSPHSTSCSIKHSRPGEGGSGIWGQRGPRTQPGLLGWGEARKFSHKK